MTGKGGRSEGEIAGEETDRLSRVNKKKRKCIDKREEKGRYRQSGKVDR